MVRRKAAALVGLAVALVAAFAAAPAYAVKAEWTCASSAVRATVVGGEPVDPIRTDRTPCATSATGLQKTTEAVGLAPAIKAETAYAITGLDPAVAKPMDSAISSAAGVEGLSINSGDTIVIGVDAARSTANAACANGVPSFVGASELTGLTINGQKASLDGVLTGLLDPISNSPLGAIVDVRLNEQVKDASGLIQRAAHIKVLSAIGEDPLVDIIIAESRVSSSEACNPNAEGNADGSATGSGTTSGSELGQVCPKGSTLDTPRSVCVIAASATGGQGEIVVGPPFSGPSGGTVVALNVARKRYKSACLAGNAAPRYAVIGTSGRDRITGTNRKDRILGLGGNDSLDGGRENDCIDGGTGSDSLSGGLGLDRIYGGSGRDRLNGGSDDDSLYGGTGNDALNGSSGNDLLSGGSGNDSINAAYGRDRILGGSGNDAINISTQGPRATVDCGAGRDSVRANKKERKGLKNCERVFALDDV